jgi:AraC family transcriptional regulator, regulatory protein of adaptative response / methylated-DNA-[protein]-cysteine methyltransferase
MTIDDFRRAFFDADPAYDGRFVAMVRTTGIYCRPSCRGRKPFPQNVAFVADATAARAAGYRACLRCHPDEARPVATREITTIVGPMTLGATRDALVLADFTDRPMLPAQLAAVRRRFGPTTPAPSPILDAAERQLAEFLAGRRRAFDLPIDAPGSPFQASVWAALREIPYGETVSYAQLARRVDVPAGSRAVGRANGANRLAIIIPCHRVVASGGGLGGYGGGLPAKRFLLNLETRGGTRSAGVA